MKVDNDHTLDNVTNTSSTTATAVETNDDEELVPIPHDTLKRR